MAFADGENLVARFQASLDQQHVPREDVQHERDAFVWHSAFTENVVAAHEIIRVTYFTSAVGNEERLNDISDRISSLRFTKHYASGLPSNVTPCILKRHSGARATKGLDIRLCVEVLSQVYRRNVDAILLLTGDGDYAPLIDEAKRHGVQVYLAAFRSGLNGSLRRRVDDFWELDDYVWKEQAVAAT